MYDPKKSSYTGEGVANEDEQGALRLADGQQVGRVDRTSGEVLIGRKLRDGGANVRLTLPLEALAPK